MNNLNLEITSKALSDVATITEYIQKDNRKAAFKLSKYIYEQFKRLTKHPYLGQSRSDFTYLDTRFLIVKKNYLIVYRIINDNTVRILRVLATYQDVCSLL